MRRFDQEVPPVGSADLSCEAGMSALDRAVAQLAAIGAAASADDDHGRAWSEWADHCWRLGVPPTPADGEILADYIADYLDPSEARTLREALLEVGS